MDVSLSMHMYSVSHQCLLLWTPFGFRMSQLDVWHAASACMLCVLCMLCLAMTLNLPLPQAVEKSPAELKVSDVKSMLGTWKQAFA